MAHTIIHAYVVFETSASATKIFDKVEDLAHVFEPQLHPLSSPTILSRRIIYLPFISAQSLSNALELRTLRQSPSCRDFEREYSAEVVLLVGEHCDPRDLLQSDSQSDLPSIHQQSERSQRLNSFPAPTFPLRLAVFDMDSTLIDQEVIDELAQQVGRKAEVQAITERAMRGELDFARSLTERVAMLRGVRADVWEELKGRLTIANGARELCRTLKERGVRMAVLSGGFMPMVKWLMVELGMEGKDVGRANQLLTSPPNTEFNYSHLTGQLDPHYPIIDSARKRELLLSLAAEDKVPLSQVLCVGDGANDLPMLLAVGEAGGIALACRAKPKVQAEAPNRLGFKGQSEGLGDVSRLINGKRELAEGSN